MSHSSCWICPAPTDPENLAMQTLIFENDVSPGISVLTLNRPDVLNAFNTAMWRELWTLLRELAYDTTLSCLIIQGAGPRAFSAARAFTRALSMVSALPSGPKADLKLKASGVGP